MPHVQWKWEVGPQTVISGLSLMVMLGGVLSIVFGIAADIRIAQSQVADLRASVTTIINVQQQQAVDNAGVRAKVEVMLPAVQKIEEALTQSYGYPRRGDAH